MLKKHEKSCFFLKKKQRKQKLRGYNRLYYVLKCSGRVYDVLWAPETYFAAFCVDSFIFLAMLEPPLPAPDDMLGSQEWTSKITKKKN